jgi:alpha-beta hydrolase superfamily lysophospholipase
MDRFQAKGYTCLAPAWPGRDKPVELLRKDHPDPQLGKLTLTDVVEHLAQTVEKSGEEPILIGHSMGGLIVQLLLQRNLAAAGVAISSAPPMGVFTTRLPFLSPIGPILPPLSPKPARFK